VLVVVLVLALRRARWHLASGTGRAIFALLVFALLNALVSGDINDNRFLIALAAISLALPARDEVSDPGSQRCATTPVAGATPVPGFTPDGSVSHYRRSLSHDD
jgi:hypothetical protein